VGTLDISLIFPHIENEMPHRKVNALLIGFEANCMRRPMEKERLK